MMFDIDPTAVIIQVPTLIKASMSDGKRILEVEASCEEVDLEGDLVLQAALLGSSPGFIKNGMIDIEHYGEIGERLGVPDPISYIIGKPLEVYDLGDKRTGVRAEIMRSADGIVDPDKNRYDAFWKSLQSEPPVIWYSSIFAIPTEWDNCLQTVCTNGASRYVIKQMEWHSLAMTRHPMNNKIKGSAKIVKAQQYIELVKSYLADSHLASINGVMGLRVPQSMQELRDVYKSHIAKDCPYAGPSILSRGVFQDHFKSCSGCDSDMADILSHALFMSLLSDEVSEHGD